MSSGLLLDFFVDVFLSDPDKSSFMSPTMDYPGLWSQMSLRQHDDSLRMTEINERTPSSISVLLDFGREQTPEQRTVLLTTFMGKKNVSEEILLKIVAFCDVKLHSDFSRLN